MDCAAGAVSRSRLPANVASNNGCAVELYMQAVWLHFLKLVGFGVAPLATFQKKSISRRPICGLAGLIGLQLHTGRPVLLPLNRKGGHFLLYRFCLPWIFETA
jgi:hypothetical protein